MIEDILSHSETAEPAAFTQEELGWRPWLEPLGAEQLTDRHWAGLVDASRAKSPYFLLLVRDPDVLEARTKTDKDIFYNTNQAFLGRSANLRPRRHHGRMVVSSARLSIPDLPRNIPNVEQTCSVFSTKASVSISTLGGMRS